MAAGLTWTQASSFQPTLSIQHPVPRVAGMRREGFGGAPTPLRSFPSTLFTRLLKNRHPTAGN